MVSEMMGLAIYGCPEASSPLIRLPCRERMLHNEGDPVREARATAR
jgi:hypothetical protein